MNERIRELIDQSYLNAQSQSGRDITYFDKEKFAELIIRECAEAAARAVKSNTDKIYYFESVMKSHFGVEE